MGQYEELTKEIILILKEKNQDSMQRVVDSLQHSIPHYSWVGIYLVDQDMLQLGPWAGPHATEHVRIPIGTGICGSAAKSGKTEVIDDVTADTRYLSCFLSTKSEIVVPINHLNQVVGEIDIDSDRPHAFTSKDIQFLEKIADMLGPHIHKLS